MSERSFTTKSALFLAALVVISYWPVFLGRVPLTTDDINQFPPFRSYYYEMSVRVPHAELGDTITEVYPWRKFAAESIRSGVIPLWNPNLFAGTPFQANPLTALFNPFNFIFILLPVPVAWSLAMMLKVFLAAWFTYLFLREIGASVSGAIVAAIAFAFGGFMTAWLGWPRADTVVWLPLLCFQVHRLCRQPTRRNAILLALALALPIFAGHPGTAARTLVTAAGYGLWIVITQHSASYRRQLLWLSLAGLLAVGIAAMQLVPTAEWLDNIFRTLDMLGGPLPSSQAVGLFSRDVSSRPHSAGVYIPEAAIYAGVVSLLVAAFSVFHRVRKDVIFFAIVFVISFGTAFEIGPFYKLTLMLPVFRGLRMDEALSQAAFSIAVLAGLGASYLENFEWKRIKKIESITAVIVLLLTTALLHKAADVLSKVTQRGAVDWWDSPRSFRVLLMVGAFLIALRLLQLLQRRQWIVLASLLIAADLVSYSYGHVPFNRPETIYPDVPLFRFLSQRPKPFRVVSVDNATPGNVEYVYGLATASGYEYMLARLALLLERFLGEPVNGYAIAFSSKAVTESNNRILDLLNVRYLVATRINESESKMRAYPNRYREIWSDGDSSVFENLTCLPRAFLVPQANVEAIPSEDAQLARLVDSSFDPERRVILPTGLAPNEIVVAGGSQEVVNFSEGLNWIRMQVNATTPSVLVLSQIYYPGWRVYVDGKRAELLRPDYAFTGTIVDTGTHDVEFRFLPTTFIVGSLISIASILLAVVLYCYKRLPSSAEEGWLRQ